MCRKNGTRRPPSVFGAKERRFQIDPHRRMRVAGCATGCAISGPRSPRASSIEGFVNRGNCASARETSRLQTRKTKSQPAPVHARVSRRFVRVRACLPALDFLLHGLPRAFLGRRAGFFRLSNLRHTQTYDTLFGWCNVGHLLRDCTSPHS